MLDVTVLRTVEERIDGLQVIVEIPAEFIDFEHEVNKLYRLVEGEVPNGAHGRTSQTLHLVTRFLTG